MTRFRRHLPSRLVCLLVTVGLAAPGTALASGDPAANRTMSGATRSYCEADPAGSDCITSALADINAAHAAEGVRPMVLPGNFASMSVPVQLLNLANLERIDRGLTPILGLSAALNQDAQSGAVQDADPMPTHFYGNTATSNWAGGESSTLEADFDWMYDDGAGSGNLDCPSPGASGCWGHRHDILWHFSAPIAMGAGYASGRYGSSMTELFVGGDTRTDPGQADAPVVRPSQTAAAASSGSTGATSAARPHARVAALAPARGAVGLTVGCVGPVGSVCRVRVTLAVANGSGSHSTQVANLVVRAGRTRTVRVALDRSARRSMAGAHTAPVRIVVSQRGRTLVARTLAVRV